VGKRSVAHGTDAKNIGFDPKRVVSSRRQTTLSGSGKNGNRSRSGGGASLATGYDISGLRPEASGGVRRFPFGVFYVLEGEAVVVLAVFHASRNPKGWQSRGS